MVSHLAAMKPSLDTEESCLVNEIPDDTEWQQHTQVNDSEPGSL